ncbi:SMI1/KNR4 family protein [Paenibacillus sp. N4]|uniref:SMI1/KNR4 family protein n=1 Tax=Paenibacillus vietnamensis TaxID=2590547 RepID=UPI001CD1043E|nr:SMI1/KNR4 family protein [Paenibacillus vietnamensis]MCA0757319.1 SMI1/KNR4 family protein [Paenibacillus vietnamensis]
MNYEEWKRRIERIALRIQEIGGQVHELVIEEPATEAQIVEVERKLGFPLPTSFRSTLLEFSSHFSFSWFLPDDFKLSGKCRKVCGGSPHWGLHLLQLLDEDRRNWASKVFSNKEDEYDAVWHDKLAFLAVGNGDYMAFDRNGSDDPPVVYLSNDDGDGHGYKMGDSFHDFIEKWSKIAFVGNEDWQWMPFTSDKSSGIEPDGEAAQEFRACLRLDL